MFERILTASIAGLLLAACQQQPMAVSSPAAPLPQAYTVYFNTDQSTLSSEASATVAQAAAAFKQGGTAVGVRGHADTVGNAQYNLALSVRRAEAVKAALPDAIRAQLEPGVLPVQWYPVEVPATIQVAIRDVLGDGSWEVSHRLGVAAWVDDDHLLVVPDHPGVAVWLASHLHPLDSRVHP